MAETTPQEFITPEQVCDLIPGLTVTGLAQMRFRGVGPRYYKPSPRKVVYSREHVLAWLASTERQGTATVA